MSATNCELPIDKQLLRKKPAGAPKKSSPLVAEGKQGDKNKVSPKVAEQNDKKKAKSDKTKEKHVTPKAKKAQK